MVYYFKARGGPALEPGEEQKLVTIFMGKDKFENEDLIKYGLPNDVWFHVDRLSSAHVYIRCVEGRANSATEVQISCLRSQYQSASVRPVPFRPQQLLSFNDCTTIINEERQPYSRQFNDSYIFQASRLPEGMMFDTIPQETLEDCCQLVKANSIQGNKQKNVDIVYTPWENLRKSAGVSLTGLGSVCRMKSVV